MANVSIAALHSSLQFVGASAIGGLIDNIFPRVERAIGVPEDLTMDLIEIIAQITLGGVVTAGVVSFLDNYLDVDSQDPTSGIGYTLGYIYSQKTLVTKIDRVMAAMRGEISTEVDWLTSKTTQSFGQKRINQNRYVD